jgi:hypothetical protein
MIHLAGLPPAQLQGWLTLLELAEVDVTAWCLIGGQSVYAHAVNAGVSTPRPTRDMDVVADLLRRQNGTSWMSEWLVGQGFALEGINPFGIGHRFSRDLAPGPGKVTFDVLAPDHMGQRASLHTRPPARTVEVPGARQAILSAETFEVTVSGMTSPEAERTGMVRMSSVMGTLLAKAAATSIVNRGGAGVARDYEDAATLLACLPDPIAAADQLSSGSAGDRRLMRKLSPLHNPRHEAWRPMQPDDRRNAQIALTFLLPT